MDLVTLYRARAPNTLERARSELGFEGKLAATLYDDSNSQLFREGSGFVLGPGL